MATHPFFDNTGYPWPREDAQRLHKELYSTLRDQKTIELLYLQAGGQSPLAAGAGDVMWRDALEKMALASVLHKFCEKMLSDPTVRALHNCLQQVMDAQSVESEVIVGNLVFFDREGLRQQIMRLRSSTDTMKVLLIRGGRKCGKSYGRFLLEAVAGEENAEVTYVCEGVITTVREFVERLFVMLNAAAPMWDPTTTEDAWYRSVCLQLRQAAVANRRTMWIIVDDMGPDITGTPRMDERVRKFCDVFALNMVDPSFRQWFRLVFIDYPSGPVPTRWKREHWDEEVVNSNHVTAAHLAEVILQACRRRKKQPMQQWVERIAAEILAGANPDPLMRLQSLHDAIRKVVQGLG